MPGAGRANPLDQIALRHDLERDLAGAVERVEDVRVGLPRERADDLPHALRLEQRRQARLAVAGVVADTIVRSRAPWSMSASISAVGMPGHAEAADEDRRAVPDVADRLGGRRYKFADHGALNRGSSYPRVQRRARWSARWVPNSFVIACLLTLVTFALVICRCRQESYRGRGLLDQRASGSCSS